MRWLIASTLLLTFALVLSIRGGLWIEALVIGILSVPTYVILGLRAYVSARDRYFVKPS